MHRPLRKRLLLGLVMACALTAVALLLARPATPKKRAVAEPMRTEGVHTASGRARAWDWLSLANGFAVRFRAPCTEASAAPGVRPSATLRVAEVRAESASIASGFTPIGPTVALSPECADVEASFAAEGFRVRSQHRLVLAVEQHGRWQLIDARYDSGHCAARLSSSTRLQFGSVPLRAPISDSAAR